MINWHKTYQDFVEPLDTDISQEALESAQRILSTFPEDTANMQTMYQVALMEAGDIVLSLMDAFRKAAMLSMIIRSSKEICEAKKIAKTDVGQLSLSDIRGSMIYWQSISRELKQ